MSTESQNIEFKESWRDEYLKWICGFANAQGGSLLVGIRDNGDVCGVEDVKKLMEDIPNKVRDLMGILVDVNLYQKENNRKQGKTWDGVPVPYLNAKDLDNATFDLFRKYAKRSGRMDNADLMDDNNGLLDKLRLMEGKYLKRAAALLFHPDPEQFVTGAFIKIGYFKESANLIYQDEVHGNLFQQIRIASDILTSKYLRALISYEGIQRIESLPMPREALRETLLNCVVHKAYESLTPIQIAVYDNKLEIWNCGVLPEDWTIDNLLGNHRSRPYNPDIANAFFRAGEIEAWGRGIERIIEACKSAGTPVPQFKYDGGGLWTTFFFSKEYQEKIGAIDNRPETDQKPTRNRPETDQKKQEEAIVELIKGNPYISRKEIAQRLSIHDSSVKRRLVSLQERNIIERIGAAKGGYWNIIK
jgi:ATP-dependent DNA helicase RecG